MVIIKQILNSFLFWGGWIIIPFIMEIVPALGSVFLLIRRNLRHKKKRKEMKIYPEISLIIPVYNSADTLYGCIKSRLRKDMALRQVQLFQWQTL